MNETDNPYVSPQADIFQSPLFNGNLEDWPGLRTTGIGLSLVYYGVIVVILAILGTICFAVLLQLSGPEPGSVQGVFILGLAMGASILIGYLLMFAGELVCIFVPVQTGAKGFVISAVFFQIASILQSFLPLIQHYFPFLELPEYVMILLNLLGFISIMFFLLFMRKLSEFLGRKDLMAKARNILIFGPTLVAVYVAILFLPGVLKDGVMFFGIVLLIGGLICFLMYVNLVNALRKVLLKKSDAQ